MLAIYLIMIALAVLMYRVDHIKWHRTVWVVVGVQFALVTLYTLFWGG